VITKALSSSKGKNGSGYRLWFAVRMMEIQIKAIAADATELNRGCHENTASGTVGGLDSSCARSSGLLVR